ncbi:glycosyltransferase [Polynucleobacter paneuropaeus]|nr:glycosyltransferase [Polynucleobacter paneuropaeus]MBT8555584.1 glycosyltransferase [Polynucleobacter paneuropaeus]MBT8560860.1 glycosyltransferase [Polynucleobacter paneuropaeus]
MTSVDTISPLLLSQSDFGGGAARACYRLNKALNKSGVDSLMRVGVKKTDDNNVIGPSSNIGAAFNMLKPYIGQALMGLQKTQNTVMHSPAVFPSNIAEEVNLSGNDVINLHWVNNEFMSIAEIGRITKPIVWTLHDMWPFCGAEHYAADDLSARWRYSYTSNNCPASHSLLDIDRWVWRRKIKHWTHKMHIVTPSAWLANCVKSSFLMASNPVTVIPNPLDTSIFKPWDKKIAREMHGLPQNTPLILFGAIGGGGDIRKGWDLLQSALIKVTSRYPEVQCVIFGQSEPKNPPKLGIKLHWMGHIYDDIALALLYSAADVMIVPSRQENLPQSGTEAQACGCPVVGFQATGMPDVVKHGETGYLAPAFDVEELAIGILWVLEDFERRLRLGDVARNRAVSLWSEEVVSSQYLNVYKSARETHLSEGGSSYKLKVAGTIKGLN